MTRAAPSSCSLVFNYVPLFGLRHRVPGLQHATPGSGTARGSGSTNFERLFDDPLFWDALTNTLSSARPAGAVLPDPDRAGAAAQLRAQRRGRASFIQSIVYLPHFFSWVLVVTLFQQMFGGAGAAQPVPARATASATWDIMTNPDTFMLLVTAQAVWKDAGWGDHRLPRRAGRHRPEPVRGGRGGRRRPVAAAVAHHPARHAPASSCCC